MKKILVPTDFSEQAEKALIVAAQLAKKHSSEIFLLHMLELPMGLADPARKGGNLPESLYFMKLANKHFKEALNKPYLKGIKVIEMVQFQQTFEGINQAAQKYKVDLIVMGSHGATGFKEVFIGSNTEKVVRTSSVPVLVIKTKYDPFRIKNFVFASDFSSEITGAFKQAVSFAKKNEANLHLLLVNTPSHFYTTQNAHRLISDFVKSVKPRLVNISTHVYNDMSVESGILNFAHFIQADLIGMGTHGRKGLAHFLNGSISEDMVNHSQLPVITFKI